MKQQIPTPIAVAIVVIALAVIGFLGWRMINPPEPQPVGRSADQQMMPPAIPPGAAGQSAPPGQPQQGTLPMDPM
jgi:hypothetical protein